MDVKIWQQVGVEVIDITIQHRIRSENRAYQQEMAELETEQQHYLFRQT